MTLRSGYAIALGSLLFSQAFGCASKSGVTAQAVGLCAIPQIAEIPVHAQNAFKDQKQLVDKVKNKELLALDDLKSSIELTNDVLGVIQCVDAITKKPKDEDKDKPSPVQSSDQPQMQSGVAADSAK